MPHATTPPLESSDLFSDTKFFLSRGLNSETTERLRELLSEHGATEVERTEDATHVLSTSDCFIGANEAMGAIVVTPTWAERSVLLGKIQDPRYYSADPNKLFSGITATSSDLPVKDSESIAAGIVAFGGQWRPALTNDVTHLFCLSATGPKYAKALSTKDSPVPIQVVVPHWFSDCFKTETLLPTGPYLFPNPRVLDPDFSTNLVLNGGGGAGETSDDPKTTNQRKLMRAAAGIDTELGSNPGTQPSSFNKSQSGNRVLGGKRIVFSARAVQNEHPRDEVFRRRVEQVGGTYISGLSLGDGGVTKEILDDCDVYITIYREGDEYDLATSCNVIIGTPAWILYVTSSGLWSDPKEHLLHYPYYERAVRGFEDQLITITNYTGDAREYLKKLIAAMGGKFTPSMTSKNTCVIASHITVPPNQPKQNKIEKAREWRIPIVNHLWLEDSFRAWAKMALSDRKYTEYPPGIDWMQEINARGVGTGPMPDAPRDKKGAPVPVPTIGASHAASNGVTRPAVADPPLSTEDTPAVTPLRRKSSMVSHDKPRSTKSIHTSPNAHQSKPTISDSTKRKLDADTSHSSKRAKTGRPSDPASNNKGNAPASKGVGKSAQPLERTQPSSFAKDSSVQSSAFPVEPVSPEKRGRKPKRSSDDEDGDSSSSDEGDRPSLGNRSSNDLHTNNIGGRAPRAAATAAQDRLRNVIMPDVQKFQNEMQSSKGDVRKMEKLAEKQQRRASTTTRQDDDAPPAKKKKTQAEDVDTKAKKPSSKPSQSQNASKKESGKSKPATAGKATPRASDAQESSRQEQYSSIRIICTKSKPTDQEMKAMKQLGASFTEDPATCTHLVVNSIGRTEKFLCALPRCKHLVSMKWIQDSIKAGKLLKESDYTLKDPENEKKYEFNLAETIRRIKDNGGKLLEGHTFYLTDKLGVDSGIFQRVVEASGGTAKIEAKPTKKKIGSDANRHHVISSRENEANWANLKHDAIPVYSKEFILNGVLRQELDMTRDRLY